MINLLSSQRKHYLFLVCFLFTNLKVHYSCFVYDACSERSVIPNTTTWKPDSDLRCILEKNEGRRLACCIITFAAYLVSKIHKAIFVAAANDFSNKFLSISCLVTLKFKTFVFVTWLFLF